MLFEEEMHPAPRRDLSSTELSITPWDLENIRHCLQVDEFDLKSKNVANSLLQHMLNTINFSRQSIMYPYDCVGEEPLSMNYDAIHLDFQRYSWALKILYTEGSLQQLLKFLFSAYSIECPGKLWHEEYKALMRSHAKFDDSMKLAIMREFRLYDKDHDKFISEAEFIMIVSSLDGVDMRLNVARLARDLRKQDEQIGRVRIPVIGVTGLIDERGFRKSKAYKHLKVKRLKKAVTTIKLKK